MAAEIKVGVTLEAGAPRAVFNAGGALEFDAASDGRKFLLPIPEESASNEPVTWC